MGEERYDTKLQLLKPEQADKVDELRAELDHWEWIKIMGNTQFNPAARTAYHIYVEMVVGDHIQHIMNGLEVLPDSIDNLLIKWGSPEGALINRLQVEGYELIAFFVFVMFSRKRRLMALEYPDLKYVLTDPSFEYERITALGVINDFFGISALAPQGASDSVSVAAAIFRNNVENSKLTVIQAVEGLKAEAELSKRRLHADLSLLRKLLQRRRLRWKGYIKQVVAQSRQEIADAQGSLLAAKETFSAEVDLKASVEYWKERKTSHDLAKRKAFFAVIGSMILTLVVMLLYLNIDYGASNTEVVASVATTDAATHKEIAKIVSAAEVANIVSHYLGAALLLTFLGILIRIALRQYNTHTNCALEAQERMTFTKTYLALMHEGKLTSEADRRLVLEALFKPNAFSSSPEITFTTPLEMIYKAADRGK